MVVSDKNNEPWYADYANYLASRVLPFRSTRQEKQKFFSDLRRYFWDEAFLFKHCADRIIRRCTDEDEAAQILWKCHNRPYGGHHGIATNARKVFEAGFYWPHIFRNARRLINELDEMRLDAYESSISYKERTKRWHDKRIKASTNYERGDKVLLFNSRLRLFSGKLKSRWY
uniref:Reverse transcriptase domain-containing protein n=1 Tax=Tanacetum cinerariifolium TaxID=118510 RepID=A0A6L2N7M5_TANCI|nr:reverse transcriptase domain-containing protein [Tanacetum cinerariifolium]